ncbi:MAG: GerMN domain-containing protein [Acidimicrobiales bacterium]
MTSAAWRVLLAACLLLLPAVVSGCGIPVDQGPTALPRSGVPFGLLEPSASTTTSTTIPAPVEVSVVIFIMGPGGHLVGVSRDVPFPAPLTTILGALVDGPTNAEAAAGLQSAIPAQTAVLSAAVTAGVATVDLGGTFGQLVGQAQIEAVAQIVFTATALPGVTGVAFALSGQPVEVPVANGAQVPMATRAQFTPLAPA